MSPLLGQNIRMILIILLCVHTVATVIALKETSVWAVFPPFRDDFVYQIFSDLVSSLGIVFLLCYLRLKEMKRSFNGLYITMVGTIFFGSFSPLIYLLIERDLLDVDR